MKPTLMKSSKIPLIAAFISYVPCFSQFCSVADAGPNKFICPGSSTQIGTAGQSGFLYYWMPVNGLSNIYTPQPTANPVATTGYTLTALPPNLILNGDFESGLRGWSTDYGIYPKDDGTCSSPPGSIQGSVLVTDAPRKANLNWCSRVNFTNHTPNGSKMLVIDGSCGFNRRVWYADAAVNPNTAYYFYGWAESLYPDNGDLSHKPNLRVRINGVDVLNNYILSFQNCNNQWEQMAATWTSGNSVTNALIEIFDDNRSGPNGNDFALDDVYLSDCPVTTSQVTVTVAKPVISPSRQVDVCYQYEGTGTTLLTSSLSSGNQWYKDGVLLNGETNQTLTVSSGRSDMGTGNYSVSANGCTSESVYVKFKRWSGPSTYAAPSSYCKGKAGTLYQNADNLPDVTTRQYYWEINGVPVAQGNPNSNYCSYTFPDTYQGTTASVKAIKVSDGCVSEETYNVTVGAWEGIKYTINQCMSRPLTININASSVPVEDWDFGAGASPGYQTSNPQVWNAYEPVNVIYTTPGTKLIMHYEYAHWTNWDQCYEEHIQVNVDGSCRIIGPIQPESVSTVEIFPNPAVSSITIKSNEVIETVEISSVSSHLPLIINGNGSSSLKVDLNKFEFGVYTCKVKTKKGIYNSKFIVGK